MLRDAARRVVRGAILSRVERVEEAEDQLGPGQGRSGAVNCMLLPGCCFRYRGLLDSQKPLRDQLEAMHTGRADFFLWNVARPQSPLSFIASGSLQSPTLRSKRLALPATPSASSKAQTPSRPSRPSTRP